MSTHGFRVRVEMLADWHVGTGAGRGGDVDRLVARDHEDLPYIPAKTVTGIIRDAAEQVGLALDRGGQGWATAVETVFGDQPSLHRGPAPTQPSPALLRFGPARYPQAVREALQASSALRSALTFVKPGVAIDPSTGRARTDFLRMEEMARAGSVLEADGAIDLADDSQLPVVASLVKAALLRTERLGGKRRRGAGRCRLSLVSGLNAGNPVADLAAPIAPDLRQTSATNEQTAGVVAVGGPADRWVELPLTITTRSPVVCPSAVIGNVVESLDYVPGTYLLALVAAGLGRGGIDPAGAIAGGQVRVLPATVASGGSQLWTAPEALHVPKGETGLTARNALQPEECGDVRGWHPLRQTWMGADGTKVAAPDRVSVTHGTIDDAAQRPTTDVGGVFTYQGIAPTTHLQTSVLLSGAIWDRAGDALQSVLAGEQRLGRSRKDDYGHVTIEVGAARELQQTSAAAPRHVWCATDVVLRDRWLRPDTTPEGLADAISEACGVGLEPDRHDGDVVAFIRAGRVDSWHTAWGLPRPTLVTIQAGSCLRLAATEPQTQESPATVWQSGDGTRFVFVGERQVEGYGVVIVDPAVLGDPEPELRGPDAAPFPVPVPTAGPAAILDDPFVRLVQREYWRGELSIRALYRSADAAWRQANLGWGTDKPRPSQLGGLRQAVRALGAFEAANHAARWFERLVEVPNRRDQWAPHVDTVRRLLTEQDRVFDLLGATADVPGPVRTELWGETLRTLIDVASRAHIRTPEAVR